MNKKKVLISTAIIAVFVVIFGAIFGWKMFVNSKIAAFMANFEPPAAQVTAVSVKSYTWTPYIENTGVMEALNGVDVSPQTSGQVTKILFKSGQIVKAGQPLVLLDSREAQAQYDSAVAAAELAQIDYDRQWRLFRKNAVSKSSLDTAAANLAEDQAKAQQYKTALSYKTIRAPFSGKIGIRQVDVGQYLNAGDNIADLQSMDPIHVNFQLPENDIARVYVGQEVELTVSTYPGVVFKGKINALDASLKNDTKSIEVQATIPNHNAKAILLPGMFAMVKVMLPQKMQIVAVPQQAITYTLYGDSAYVVAGRKSPKTGKQQTYAKQVYVKTGMQKGNLIEVKKGLKTGDKIVVDGQVKLQNGASIKVTGEPSDRPALDVMAEP